MKPDAVVTRTVISSQVIAGCRRQPAQDGALGVDGGGMPVIVLGDDRGDEAAVAVDRVELSGSAQEQRLGDALLDVAVPAFDGPVLVRDAAVVAGDDHAEMRGHRLERRVRSWASGRARLRNAADRLSLRCSRGAPPSRRSARSSPPARAG